MITLCRAIQCRQITRYRVLSNLRPLSIRSSDFSNIISEPSSRYQLYISGSNDPVFNLSVEHYLLQSTSPTTTILLLYINRPCIVIGRNQNPWLETNLNALPTVPIAISSRSTSGPLRERLEIIRRRSGGGTVFHDYGNVNFSVICQPESFTRDKHAEMVVRAIRQNNPRARVNERHDIVLDTGSPLEEAAHLAGQDTHHTAYEPGSPLKVSGSAYKLTRTRALHHGTCLVNSERVGMISGLLRSPLAPFVKARGVDSVKSAVGNVYGTQYGGAVELFKANVIQEFCRTYAIDAAIGRQLLRLDSATTLETFDNGIYGVLDEDLGKIEKIKEGMWEMRSTDWLYGQTPQFTFSTFSTADDPRPRPLPPSPIPSSSRVHFTARGSRITSAEFALSPSTILDSNCIVGQELHRLDTWKKLLRIDKARSKEQGEDESNVLALADWLDEIFGMRTYCSA